MTFKLFKIMKDHKNPKVLSEGILWMVSAVEDFGVLHIKLKVLLCFCYLISGFQKLVFISLKSILGLQDLIDFCKDIGLQSSTAATRNITIKLIGVLHKFVGPGNMSSICQFFVGQDL